MKVTFGIISYGDDPHRTEGVISSIIEHGPLCKEIIVVGGQERTVPPPPYCYYVPFNEDIKNAWITKKKNIITRMARFKNIVYMHDYITLTPGWDRGFDELEPWDVCMSKIEEQDGTRHRDWVAWDDPAFGPAGRIFEKWCPPEGLPIAGSMTPVPYDYTKTQYMYVSGAYWVAKKDFMLAHPLNEDLHWGQGEDVEWSYRAREEWQYKMNINSIVRFNKAK